MALVIPTGFVQFACQLTHASASRAATVTWGQEASLGTQSAEQWCNDALGQFAGNWGSRIDDDVIIGPVTGTFGNDAGDPVIASSTTTPLPGTADQDSPPSNVAVLVKKQSGLGGRKNRGRMYVPWAANELAVTDVGEITGATYTALQAAADGWLDDIQTGSGALTPVSEMVILHSEAAVTAGLPAPTPVVALVVDTFVATQRRRLRR